jgi:hypothetical protein
VVQPGIGDQKPEDKKPDEKKADEKKVEEKKPEEKKPEEKKADEKKVEETKPVPAVVAGASVEPGRKPAPDDPLNKGDALTAPQIRQKVVLKTLGDVWVRYQVDEKPAMRVVLQADKLLVLRGEKRIHVQVSNPKSVQFKYQSEGYRSFESGKTYAEQGKNAFVDFPFEGDASDLNPLKKLEALPATADPNIPSAAKSNSDN